MEAGSNRRTRKIAALIAAAAISVSIGAPGALGQEADYGEVVSPGGTAAGGAGGTTTSTQFLLKKCIAKAQTKFGDNRPKKKAAIKKCKKKY